MINTIKEFNIYFRFCKHIFGYTCYLSKENFLFQGKSEPIIRRWVFCNDCKKYFTINERLVIPNRITKKSNLLDSVLG